MKISEFNKIEEGIFSAIKDRFLQGGYQTKVQDIFIKDFVQDAITSLNNGVKGGLIDPSIKSNGKPDPAAAAAAGVSGTATQQGQGAQAPLKATTTSVKFNGPGAPGATNAAPAAGQTSTQPQTQYMGKIAPNARPATKPQAPASPFSTPTLTPRTVNTTANVASKPGGVTTGGMSIKESSYNKMNRVFESIINIDEAARLRTIGDYMMDWFGQYMQGVNWQASKQVVQQKINKLQDEYPKNVKQNLTDLARIGLALSKAASPAGAPKEFAQARQEQAGSVEDLRGALEGLAKTDPRAYNELIKNLKPVQTGFFSEDTD